METVFKINDLVRIKEEEYNLYTNEVLWNENVFRIMSIDDKNVKLYDIENEIPITAIEPIPIDGKSDACIYYASAFMADIGEKILEHKDYGTDYYVDGFEKMHVDDHTMKDDFMAKNYKYVHEVQHWLCENGSRDELRVNNTLKEKYR